MIAIKADSWDGLKALLDAINVITQDGQAVQPTATGWNVWYDIPPSDRVFHHFDDAEFVEYAENIKRGWQDASTRPPAL